MQKSIYERALELNHKSGIINGPEQIHLLELNRIQALLEEASVSDKSRTSKHRRNKKK